MANVYIAIFPKVGIYEFKVEKVTQILRTKNLLEKFMPPIFILVDFGFVGLQGLVLQRRMFPK